MAFVITREQYELKNPNGTLDIQAIIIWVCFEMNNMYTNIVVFSSKKFNYAKSIKEQDDDNDKFVQKDWINEDTMKYSRNSYALHVPQFKRQL